jgi:LmbE family N-acetylglucosaminyl deacetylase
MKILFLGSHCDDIELGCGATIHKKQKDWEIICAVFSEAVPFFDVPQNVRVKHLREISENALRSLGVKEYHHFDFPTNAFWTERQGIWQTIRSLKQRYSPDLVFTQIPDEHQDHEVLYNESVRNFQDTSVVMFKPTMRYKTVHDWDWIEIVNPASVAAKQKALAMYTPYADKLYFSPKNIESQLRVYAMQTDKAEFAEAFKIEKLIFGEDLHLWL